MPRQINLGATSPSISSQETPKKHAYTVVETRYLPNNAREAEQLKPYLVEARDKNKVFKVVKADHKFERGYEGSRQENSTIISAYQNGSKRVAVVEKGNFADNGLEAKLN